VSPAHSVPRTTPCEHRLHLSVMQSVANCADCNELLPVFIKNIVDSEDIVRACWADGLLVTWAVAGVGVADA